MTGKKEVTVGARGSKLSLTQTEYILDLLRKGNPGTEFKVEVIKTTGDRVTDRPLSNVGGSGLFVKDIEDSLLKGSVDMAVHSMKDMTTDIPEGLCIAAINERVDCRDALVSREGKEFRDLPQGARVGTSSLRRRAQLLNARPDLEIVDLRGNLDTRLKKLETENLDAIILAVAGLVRMGWEERITQKLPPEVCLPAVGQGALGIQAREDNRTVTGLAAGVDHPETRVAVAAERAFLRELQGGCQAPIGAWGECREGQLHLRGLVASLDGKTIIRKAAEQAGSEDPVKLGTELARYIKNNGGDRILAAIKESTDGK